MKHSHGWTRNHSAVILLISLLYGNTIIRRDLETESYNMFRQSEGIPSWSAILIHSERILGKDSDQSEISLLRDGSLTHQKFSTDLSWNPVRQFTFAGLSRNCSQSSARFFKCLEHDLPDL